MGRPRKDPEQNEQGANGPEEPDDRYEGPRPQNDDDYRDAGQAFVDELEQGPGAA